MGPPKSIPTNFHRHILNEGLPALDFALLRIHKCIDPVLRFFALEADVIRLRPVARTS